MIIRLKQITAAAGAFVLGVAVLIMSENVRRGVIDSIDLCISTVIPSLFLFTVIANLALKSGLCEAVGKLAHKFSQKIFNLSGEQFAVFLLSLFSGYPVGAGLVTELLKLGKISQYQARRMICFCVSAGPAFVIVAVGEAALGHRSDGYRLFAAHLISSVLLCFSTGILSRIFDKRKQPQPIKPCMTPENRNIAAVSFSENFTASAINAAKSMFNVCTFVIVFGALGRLITTDSLPLSPFGVNFMRGITEVTAGVHLFGRGRLPLIAFLLGFGGISVHFQVLSIAAETKVKYFLFLLSRLTHGVISATVIGIWELICPRYIDTAVTHTPTASLNGSPLATVSMLLLGVVLIVYSSKSRQNFAKSDTSC